MRISDWSSDVCSSDLVFGIIFRSEQPRFLGGHRQEDDAAIGRAGRLIGLRQRHQPRDAGRIVDRAVTDIIAVDRGAAAEMVPRSEEHTSELQSLMRISYAVFCLKKKKYVNTRNTNTVANKT